MQNAMTWSTMPQYKEQAHGKMRNAAEQRTTPRLKEQRHGIPSHGKKCHCTTQKAQRTTQLPHNAATNKVAQCTMQLQAVPAGRMMANTKLQTTSTAMQWRCQWRHQATAARIFPLPKKRIIKPDYFVVSIFTGFSFSGKVSGVFTQGRLFRVGGRHRCPWWLKPVDCFVKVFLLGLTFRIGYA